MSRILRPAALTAAVLTAAALLAATGATASEPSTEQNGDGTRKRDDPNEMVCRYERVTGSHMRQRICHTRREWDQLREASQRALRDRPHHNTDRPQ